MKLVDQDKSIFWACTVLWLIFTVSSVKSQDLDIHYSQFYHTPLFHNPALTGAFQEDIRLSGVYRRQWQSIPVPYMTFGAAGDMKLPTVLPFPGQLSAGISFAYDEAGDSELSFTQLGLHGSYGLPVNEWNMLSIGLQLGFGIRSFSTDNLTFGAQFDGELFNPMSDPGENFNQTQTTFFDVSTGLNWRFQKSRRLYFNIGSGVFHLNRPKVNFIEEADQPWAILWNAFGETSFPVSEKIDVKASVLYQSQGPSNETVLSGGVRYWVNTARGKELGLTLRFGSRFNDAIIPSLEVDYRNWTAGISYDINTSQLNVATDDKGGPEIILIYRISRVKPVGVFETCPIF